MSTADLRSLLLLASASAGAAALLLWLHRRRQQVAPLLKPKRLILVRHGESQGNVDQNVYASVPDHALHLTERGWTQALCAGNAGQGWR